MRLLFVVQRYGPEVAGGAELACRQFATRLAATGHQVEVLTTTAVSYVDWAPFYPSGTQEIDGVAVHRLPVTMGRLGPVFGGLYSRVHAGPRVLALHVQKEWVRYQGPFVPDLIPWLEENAGAFDVVIFFTYLYYPTWAGLPVAAALAPTVLHPTAHDEPPFHLQLFDLTFHLPSAFAYLTPEEAELVQRRSRSRVPSATIGIGMDLDVSGNEAAFRQVSGVGDRPYLVYLGRIDPGKGAEELFDFFVAYKERNPGDLTLAYVGEKVKRLPDHKDVIFTGFVNEETRAGALEGTLALVQPSYFESFSMVLTEAWAHRKPALVQGHCAVLEGQARRSGGGIPYRGFAEFEAGLDLILEDPSLRSRLGDAGRRYVEDNLSWEVVLAKYQQLLGQLA